MTGHEQVLQRMRLANPAPSSDPEELAAVLSVIEEKRDAIPTAATSLSKGPSRQIAGRVWYRRPAAVVAFAALGVCAVIIPIAVFAGGGSDTVSDPSPTAPSTTIAAPTVATAPLTWERVHDQNAFTDAAIVAVTTGGPGLVAVGEADEEALPDEYRGDVAVWVSADGTAWERVHDPSFTGEPDSSCTTLSLYQGVWRMASGPLGIVAVGRDACNGAVWISEDGRTWDEVIDDDWLGNPVAVEGGVTAGGPGWVAVGGDGHGNGAIWASDNGVDWTASPDSDLLAPTGSRVDLLDVTTGGPGLVAVGSTGFIGTGSEQSAIWVSTDGFDWEKLPDDTIDHGALFRIARDETSDRLMAFSRPTVTMGQWMTWTSSDGINWSPVASPGKFIDGVVWNDDRLVAAGLVSTDGGATWTDISSDLPELDRSYTMRDVTGFGDQIVIVGYQLGAAGQAGWGTAGGSTAAIWIGERAAE